MTIDRPHPLSGRPTATVVVPCYNYGHHLPQLLAGLFDQPGVDVGVIIVDDSSPDGSGEVAERLAESDSRITVIRHARNAGHIQTYNDGLTAADGEYVVLLSADDLLPAGALTRAIALMQHHPSVGLVYGYALPFFSDEPPPVSGQVRNWSVWSGQDWLAKSARQARSFIMSPEVVMRTQTLRETGLYDRRLPHSADLDLWLRTALNWDVGRVNGPPQALYRVHQANMHLTTYAGWITDLRERLTTFDLLYDEHAPDRPDVQALRPATNRALAKDALRRAGEQTDPVHGPDRRRELLEFAELIDPTLVGTRAWAAAKRPRTGLLAVPGKIARRVSAHLEWRWGRRYGT